MRDKIDILNCEVDIDHVHVLASLPLTMTPSQAVHKQKGLTAKCLFVELPMLRKLYKREHFWSPGKFAGSVEHITLGKAKKYLEEHHAKALTGIPAPKGSSVARGINPWRMSILF